MEGLGPLKGQEEISLLRCATCRKGFDTSHSNGVICPSCHGKKWTNQIGRMTVRQRIKVYRMSGAWFQQDPPDNFDRFAVAMEPFITALERTNRDA